ncbi:hypothetical protein Glove_8g30 [Diversispora epigaea]|uniref:Uncharacterized protein n=1 Tax=Diversispora epigaea TaxID=1348612 RepID=A0A397JVI0_9GLOM|nr:hypothetical protein Glove_8g30 [Diversispora epigaea]
MKNSPSGRRIQVGKRIKKKKRNVQFRIRFPELRRKEEREIPMTTVYSNSQDYWSAPKIFRAIMFATFLCILFYIFWLIKDAVIVKKRTRQFQNATEIIIDVYVNLVLG